MLRISLVAIAAALLGACGGTSPLSPEPVTPSQLASAPTRVVLDGKRLTLAASLGRDFMPISPPDGKPLTAVLRIKAEDGLPVPTTIVGDSAWVIRQTEIWSTSVIPEPRESSAASYDLRVTDGPSGIRATPSTWSCGCAIPPAAPRCCAPRIRRSRRRGDARGSRFVLRLAQDDLRLSKGRD